MLEKCLIGNYINPSKIEASNKPKTLQVLKTLQIPILPTASLTHKTENDMIPAFDAYQSLNKATLVFYTKIKELLNEHIIFDFDENTGCLVLHIYNFDTVYEYKIGKIYFYMSDNFILV